MQLRKSISVVLAFFLLVSSGGWSLNIHYCGGEIASITTFDNINSKCCDHHTETKACCSSEEEEEGCCSDDVLQVELEDTVINVFSIDFNYVAILPDFDDSFISIEIEKSFLSHLHYYCESNAPPLYLLYSQLVFYA